MYSAADVAVMAVFTCDSVGGSLAGCMVRVSVFSVGHSVGNVSVGRGGLVCQVFEDFLYFSVHVVADVRKFEVYWVLVLWCLLVLPDSLMSGLFGEVCGVSVVFDCLLEVFQVWCDVVW